MPIEGGGRLRIIQEYRRVTEEIAVIESKIESANRQMRYLWRAHGHSTFGGIDYSAVRVQGSGFSPGDMESALKVFLEIQQMQEELAELYAQLDKLKQTIQRLGNKRQQAVILRIEGKTYDEIACRLGITKRQAIRRCEFCENVT